MNWIQNLSRAVDYIENNLTEEISLDEVARQAYSSNSHFQLIFHVVMGITVGEYIRNRRLSQSAFDLLKPNSRIIDVAVAYQYDTQESFSKAFTRFHGVSPSKITRGVVRVFNPLTITVAVQGGFEMAWKLNNNFHFWVDWNDLSEQANTSPAEKNNSLIRWANDARQKNPLVFDAITEWLLDDSQWITDAQLVENEQILMQGVFGRFKEQNIRLRVYLKELESSGVINDSVFKVLDNFDKKLSEKLFNDFTNLRERSLREKIAGNMTGRFGTDNVENKGYINYLKDYDAKVQWCLFMPDLVRRQMDGFQIDSFEYKHMPAFRFIGKEFDKKMNKKLREEVVATLNLMSEHKSGFDYDLLFMHHYGKGVDKELWHGFWGRFMAANTPVPEGFAHWDFVPGCVGEQDTQCPTSPDDTKTPYLTFRSQFAYAQFSGDVKAMHKREGYDSDAMYDVTRNIILGQGVTIPYPEIYWTAEVHLDGYDNPSTAFLFSVAI